VIIPGELKKGEFVEVEIIDAVDYDLIGELVTREESHTKAQRDKATKISL
jgi:hypothetical protein